jgi:hypothetical protein
MDVADVRRVEATLLASVDGRRAAGDVEDGPADDWVDGQSVSASCFLHEDGLTRRTEPRKMAGLTGRKAQPLA